MIYSTTNILASKAWTDCTHLSKTTEEYQRFPCCTEKQAVLLEQLNAGMCVQKGVHVGEKKIESEWPCRKCVFQVLRHNHLVFLFLALNSAKLCTLVF